MTTATRRSRTAEKRTHELTIRLAPDELASIKATAAKTGMSMADLARRRLLDAGANLTLAGTVSPVRPGRRSYTPADPALLREIARIGNNLNQLARAFNSRFSGIDRVAALANLAAMQSNLLSLLPQQGPQGRAAPETQNAPVS